ncbi:MAG TPA: glycosyltransferase family 9 protein [Syntrophales bacterium]|nr:glycosyltransferase family 9 protein [Syntrophales bacterium]
MMTSLKPLYLGLRSRVLRATRGLCQEDPVPLHPVSIRKILFVRLDRIGDVVLSTPAFRALKKHFPSAELTVLLRSSTRGLVEQNPHVDRILTIDHAEEALRVIRELRAMRFDLLIDPYDDWPLESALIAGLSGARIRIGYAVAGREAFFSVPLRPPVPERHLTDIVLDSLKPLGVSAADAGPEIFLSGQEMQSARKWLDERAGGLPVIAFHPGATFETQRWPLEHFFELGTLLLRDGRWRLLVVGGPADRPLISELARRLGEGALSCISSDIRRFCALLAGCRLLICNNSGPLHIGTALGIPTVSFMGPTAKDRWFPYGEHHAVLRVDELPCIGCNAGICRIGTHDCMRRISPEDVFGVIRGMVNKPFSGRIQCSEECRELSAL